MGGSITFGLAIKAGSMPARQPFGRVVWHTVKCQSRPAPSACMVGNSEVIRTGAARRLAMRLLFKDQDCGSPESQCPGNPTNQDLAAWSDDKFRLAASPGRLWVNPLEAIRPS
jgi:hypothetical protein